MLYQHFRTKLNELQKKRLSIENAMSKALARDEVELTAAQTRVNKIRALSQGTQIVSRNTSDRVDDEDSITTRAQHLARQSKLDKAAAQVQIEQARSETKDVGSMAKNDPMRVATRKQANHMLNQAHSELAAATAESEQSKQLFIKAMHSADRAAAMSSKQADALNALNAANDNQRKAQVHKRKHQVQYSQRLAALKSTRQLIEQEMQTTQVQTQLDKAVVRQGKRKLHDTIVREAHATATGHGPASVKKKNKRMKRAATALSMKGALTTRTLPKLHNVHTVDSAFDGKSGESPAEKKFIDNDIAERHRSPTVNSYKELQQFIRNRDKMLQADDDSAGFSLPKDHLKAALPLNY